MRRPQSVSSIDEMRGWSAITTVAVPGPFGAAGPLRKMTSPGG